MLIVKSHDDTRDLYAEYLHQCGFVVVTAASTDDALRHAASADAVVTGIAVDGTMNGIGLVESLRRMPATARTPILVVTSHVFDLDRVRALQAGADVFLPKPCLPEDLVNAIRRLLAPRDAPPPCTAADRSRVGRPQHVGS